MRCPYCGQQNPNNATRCSRCGRHLERVREKKKEKSILLIGIVLVAVILAAGVGAMFGISNILSNTTDTAEEPQKVTIVSTPEPTPTEAVATASSAQQEEESVPLQADSVEETPTPTPTEEPVTASLTDVDALNALVSDGYGQAGVASSTATSTISQPDVDNDPHVLYDGADWSSWQEGVDGAGQGESVTLTFDKLYKVRCIALKLGNWYHDISYYTRNNRPKQLTFVLGSQQVTVDFPDEKQVQYVELSEDVECNTMQIIINDIYSGDQYDDTCICEVTTYGKASDGSAATNTAVVTPAPDSSTQTTYSSNTTYSSGTETGTAGTTDTGTAGDTGTDTYTSGTDTTGTEYGTEGTGTDTETGTGTTG